MRNLKRALSLALAAVMVIGMMVIGAGATFSDKESIKNTEAVDVVNTLGIINGLPDGSYGPEQLVDRASMAKMITLALNGGVDTPLGTMDKPTYSDIKGTWAESYIEYCSSLKIIAGDGAGKFNPTGSITGSQAAKMLLVALGYDSTVFKFTGASWEINVNVKAADAKLYNGLNINVSAPLTRDSAAQMIFNALNAKVMEKKPALDVATGNITYTYELGTKTMLEVEFGAVKLTGIVTGNEFSDLGNGLALAEGKTAISLDDVTLGINSGTFNVSTGADVLGRTVTLFAKPGTSNLASKATVIGTPTVSAVNTVVTLTESKTATGMTNYMNDNKLKTDGATLYSINYGTAAAANSGIVNTNAAGVELTFIDNDDNGKVDYVIQFAPTFGKVVSYNTNNKGSISVSAFNRNAATAPLASMTNSSAKDDVVGFDTVAKDDYVLFYSVGGNDHVEKVTTVQATINSIRGDKIIADGTTYAQSGLVTGVDDNNALLATAVNNSLGKTVKLFLDRGNNVLRVADADSTMNYALLETKDANWSNTSENITAKLILSDGTSVIAKTYLTDGTTKSNPNTGTVYTYSVNNDGSYELRAVPASVAPATNGYTADNGITAITKGNVSMPGADAGTVANSKTIFVVKNGTSYTSYTGISNVPSLTVTGAAAFGVYKDSSKAFEIVFITDSNISGAEKTIYAITGTPTITKNGDKTTYTYDVVYEGKYQQLTGSNAGIFGGTPGLYIDVKVNGTEITAAGTPAPGRAAQATRNTNGLISNGVAVGGVDVFTCDSKTIFLTIDKDGDNADEMVMAADIGSVVIDSVNAANTSTIVIVPGTSSDNRTAAADYVFILK